MKAQVDKWLWGIDDISEQHYSSSLSLAYCDNKVYMIDVAKGKAQRNDPLNWGWQCIFVSALKFLSLSPTGFHTCSQDHFIQIERNIGFGVSN